MYTFKAYNLPEGLDINTETGEITGIINDDGESRYTAFVVATERATRQEVTIKIDINTLNRIE
jgi:hypothetical protein